jgi:hypothetical protein
MATGFQILGSSGLYNAAVDSVNNLAVTTPQSLNSTNSTKVGYTFLACGPNNRALQTFGPMGRLSTGAQTLELFDPIDGAAVNNMIWTQNVVTMAIAQSAVTGFLVLNSAAITTINTSCQIATIKQIQLIQTFVPTVRMTWKTPNVPQSNATMELGFLECSGSTAPTNGAFFRWSSASEFKCITVFNSVETPSAALTAPTVNALHTSHITFRGNKVEFWIDEALVAEVANPAGNPNPTNSSRIQLGARIYTGATIPVTAPELHIAAVCLWRNDLQTNKLWPSQMSSIGRHACQSPATAFGQTQNWVNSTVAATAVLSNTTPSYTTLGGLFAVTTAFTAAADNLLFGYQVPVGFQLFVTDVRVGGAVTTVLGATATALHWGLAVNASAVSLATVDTFGSNIYGYRRVYLGTHGLIAAAVVGTTLPTLEIDCTTPYVIDSLRYVGIILRAAASPATGAIQGGVTIGGYFE